MDPPSAPYAFLSLQNVLQKNECLLQVLSQKLNRGCANIRVQSDSYETVYMCLVPRRGLEPPRPCGHQHLKLACLPITPPGQGVLRARNLQRQTGCVNATIASLNLSKRPNSGKSKKGVPHRIK